MFEAKDVLARVEKLGDLFEPVQKLKQKLPQLAGLAPESTKEKEKKEEKREAVSIAAEAEARPRPIKKKTNTKPKGKPAAKRRKL